METCWIHTHGIGIKTRIQRNLQIHSGAVCNFMLSSLDLKGVWVGDEGPILQMGPRAIFLEGMYVN